MTQDFFISQSFSNKRHIEKSSERMGFVFVDIFGKEDLALISRVCLFQPIKTRAHRFSNVLMKSVSVEVQLSRRTHRNFKSRKNKMKILDSNFRKPNFFAHKLFISLWVKIRGCLKLGCEIFVACLWMQRKQVSILKLTSVVILSVIHDYFL